MKRLLASVMSLALAAACGGAVDRIEGDGGGGGAVTGSGGEEPSGVTVGSGGSIGEVSTYSLTIGPFDVVPGQEDTQCVVLDLGNEVAGMLRSVRTELSPGSHHMIVTKVDEGVVSPEPSPCGAFAHGGDALFIAEKPEMKLAYPSGSGLPIAPHQLIGLEMHFINAGASGNLGVTGTVHLEVTEGQADLREVALLFDGNFNVSIPPMSQATFTSEHHLPVGAALFGLTSHTHRLGVKATIFGGDELLHESTSWAEPPFDVFSPPRVAGPDDSLVLTCDYDNPTADHVSFGVGYYDEMCFLWAHYLVP